MTTYHNAPSSRREPLGLSEAIAALATFMQEKGIAPPPPSQMAPGKLIRFATKDRRGDDAGWLSLFDDYQGAAFGDWRTGASHIWLAHSRDVMSAVEKAALRRQLHAVRMARKEETRARHEAAARLARTIWNVAGAISTDNPYLARKGISLTGNINLRQMSAFDLGLKLGYSPTANGEQLQGNVLLVPYSGLDAELASIECIDGAGRKWSLLDGKRAGQAWLPFSLPTAAPLLIVVAEGCATVLSLLEHGGAIIIGAGSAGNLKAVALAVRARFQNSVIIIAGDRNASDKSTSEKQAHEAAEAVGGRVIFPKFDSVPAGQDTTDFNDMSRIVGREKTRLHIAAALDGKPDCASPAGAATTIAASSAGTAASKDLWDTEDGIARDFVGHHGGDVRYDHTSGRWYVFNGSLWRVDSIGRVPERIRDHVRAIGEKPWLSHRAMQSINKLAQTDPRVAVEAEHWNRDKYLLGVPGGVIDLRTGETVAEPRTCFVTHSTAVAPALGVPHQWLAFLEQVTGGDKDLIVMLQRWAGYGVTGDVREQVLAFLYGDGGTGKGTFLNTLLRLFGDYGYAAPISMFASGASWQHPTGIAALVGKRFVVASETSRGVEWAEDLIKWLTGGDRLTARFMRRDFFSFQPSHKLTISGNHAPTISVADHAMKRRIRVVPFDHRPAKPDEALIERLWEEAPQILHWAIEGCLDWQRHGLPTPNKVAAATDSYFEMQHLFDDWIAECCALAPDAVEPTTELLRSWNSFRSDYGNRAENEQNLLERLRRLGFRGGSNDERARIYGRRRRVVVGIRLKRLENATAVMRD